MSNDDKERLVLFGLLLTTVGVLYTINQNPEPEPENDLDGLSIWGKLLFLWTCCAVVVIRKKDKANSDAPLIDQL